MNRYELHYKDLLRSIIQNGSLRQTRTGETVALFNQQLSVKFDQGFPLLTGRKLFIKNIIAEFQWMLKGDTNIKFLQERGVTIWDAWADENGDLGPTYGAQLAKQWQPMVNKIISQPHGRRHVINLWNVDLIDDMALPPCYYSLQFYTIWNHLCLSVTFRSSDAAVGLPYDVAVLSLFLYEMAHATGLQVGELHCNLTDVHINLENQAGVNEYLGRSSYALPSLHYESSNKLSFHNYYSEPHIKMIVKP